MVNYTELQTSTEIRIDNDSRIPKYRQIINSIIHDIERGILQIGQRVPSINEISEEYYLSRDTVEKAYNFLKEKQIIVSAKGKGYYVARAIAPSKHNVLFLMNKLSSYKLEIYNSFVNSLGSAAHVDLSIYHCDPQVFLSSLQEGAGRYDYYVVMPHFRDANANHLNENKEVLEALKKIPEDKLIVIDNCLPSLGRDVAVVHQDFRADIYESLQEAMSWLKTYQKLVLVFPSDTLYPYPSEILRGFKEFCQNFNFPFEVANGIPAKLDTARRDAYIVIEENDLVKLMKHVQEKGIKPGREIGIISYNDTPLKELLGITVMSTDFRVMGETAAYMLSKRKKEVVKNVFHFINRNSI
jgi:DNA-binding transcriptional regulator YhcF (GntR family)